LKILDITDFYSDRGGGIRSHLMAKGRCLSSAGIEHVVVAPGREDEEILSASGGIARARVLRVGGWRQPWDTNYHFLNRLGRVREIIRREAPDVVELNSPYLAALGALSLGREPRALRTLFWHSDHVDTILTPELVRRLGHQAAELCTRPFWSALGALSRRCDATFAASRWQAEKLRCRGFPRVVEVPFGVDKRAFDPGARSAARRRELIGPGPENAMLLVGLGRLSREKHWDVVLEAFFAWRGTQTAVLVIFGEGPERARLARQIGARDDVRLLGFESDPVRLGSALASADALVHGCPYETFGLGVAEAVSAGLPVVVPDAGGAAELAEGPSAETYEAGSAAGCSAALERLLSRDPELVRQAARAAANRVRSVEQHFSRVVEVYRELLAERRRVRVEAN
jgi:alpha-1,6-mannosyltransferase